MASVLFAIFLMPIFGAAAGESAQFREYRNLAAKGDASAMNEIGVAYFKGSDGVKQDSVKAVEWFRKAADGGNAIAMNNMGIVYRDGDGVEPDPAESHAWFMKAAEAGHAWAQFSVGKNYYEGVGVEQDLFEAEKWSEKAAEQNISNAVRILGLIEYRRYQNTDNESQAKRAAEWMRKAAGMGDVTAQYNLGVFYQNGIGVRKDDAEAARWFKRAAEDGDDSAQLALGRAYLRGRGVQQDYAEARRWLTAALKNGMEDAKEELAKIPGKKNTSTEDGSGASSLAGTWSGKGWGGHASGLFDFDMVLREKAGGYAGEVTMQREKFPIDTMTVDANGVASGSGTVNAQGQSLAFSLLGKPDGDEWEGEATMRDPTGKELATINFVAARGGRAGPAAGETEIAWAVKRMAAAGDAGAMTKLGMLYDSGAEGLPQDAAKAFEWYRKGAEAGDLAAAHNVGACYKVGNGTEKNYAEAYKWFLLSAEKGVADGQVEVGYALMMGRGVAKNFDAAEKWLTLAAKQDGENAAVLLGHLGVLRMRENGVTPEETAKALAWYGKAADGGDGTAMGIIGATYNDGEGVPRDFVEAGRWFERAARHDNAAAQYLLGLYYLDGKGREKDLGKAKRWLSEALKNGDKRAQEALARIPGNIEAIGDRPIPVAAEKILKEFADDAKAASARYGAMMLDVIPPSGGSEMDYSGSVMTLGIKGNPLKLRFTMDRRIGGQTIAIGQPIRGYCFGLEDGVIKVDNAWFVKKEDLARTAALEGVWEGTYSDDQSGDSYRVRIDDSAVELVDEGLSFAVRESSADGSSATVIADWNADDARREVTFTGKTDGGAWRGKVKVVEDGAEVFSGSFATKRAMHAKQMDASPKKGGQ